MSSAVAISPSLDRPTAAEPGSPFRVGWIVNPAVDLLCFIGGAASAYFVFFLHAGLGWNIVTIWFIWYMTLDVPHFFGTYARTYLDREELRKRRRLLLGSLAWLLAGPAVIGVMWLMYHSGNEALQAAYGYPYLILMAFVALWAYWHVVRQHYGIMALYKRKNQDFAAVDRWFDQFVLYGGLLAPFVAMAFRHDEARSGLSVILGLVGVGWLLDHGDVIGELCLGLVVAVSAAFITRQAWRSVHRQPINLPKLLFLAAVVPLHVMVCYHPATSTAGILGFTMFVTIFHDVQYHAIIWHYQRTRYRKPGESWRKYGLAGLVGRSFPLYFACAVAMGLAGGFFACKFGFGLGCAPVVLTGEIILFGETTLAHLLLGLTAGFLMLHYFVDQFIWRPGKDAELRRDLRVGSS